MTEQADLERMKAVAEAATPGEWKWWTSNSWRRLYRDEPGIRSIVLEPFVARDGHPDLTVSQEDMAFFETCTPKAVLSLISRLEEAERERDEARRRITQQAREIASLKEAAMAAKAFLVRELEEPGRTVFWKLVDALAKAEGRQ